MPRKTKSVVSKDTRNKSVKSETNNVSEEFREDNNETLQQNLVEATDFQLENESSSPDTKKSKLDPEVVPPTDIKVENIDKEEYLQANSVLVIPGLKDAIREECWDDCEDLIKKHTGFQRPELKQLQFVKEYENTLEKAVIKGFIELIKLLLHNEFPVNKVIHNSCLLMYSLKYNKMDIFNLLLEAGAEVNCRGPRMKTPLHICVEKGYFKAMELLISKGADITALDRDENGVLHVAIKNNYNEIVKLLLDHGADCNLKGRLGETPLYISTEKGYFDIVKLLLDAGADPNMLCKWSNHSPLYVSVSKSNYDIAKLLLDFNADCDLKGDYSKTPLHISTENGNYDFVQLLINNNADLDIKNKEGNTPLHVSIIKGFDNIFTLLYESGANINVRNNMAETSLILAAKNGNKTVVEHLLKDEYCDIDAESGYKTALEWARFNNHTHVANVFPDPAPKDP